MSQGLDPRSPREQRAWDALSAVEHAPQVQAWLGAADLVGANVEARKPRRRLWATAAAVAALSIAMISYLWQTTGSRYQTRVGEQRDIVLPDGSLVTLNTDTSVAVRYSDERRYIVLERGEALFAVKHNAARPFDVEAGATVTRALGTEFNVDLRPAGVTVSVLEGAVRVATPAHNASGATPAAVSNAAPFAALGKGEALEYRSSERRLVEEPANLRRIDAWRTRRLEFSDTPLADAIEEFNRYATTRLVVGSAELGRVRISGVFRIGDLDGFLFTLREALHVSTHASGNEVILLRQGSTEAAPARAI